MRSNKLKDEMTGELLRNAARLDAVPEEFQGNDAFHSFFDASNRAGFTKEELAAL